MVIDANSWYYSPNHGQICKVIETQTLWDETTCLTLSERLKSHMSLPHGPQNTQFFKWNEQAGRRTEQK